MKCPECGRDVHPDDDFCEWCDANLTYYNMCYPSNDDDD
jgi:uncharacterized OB-fold protein